MQIQILTKRRSQGFSMTASERVPADALFASVWVNLAATEQADPNLEIVLNVVSSSDNGQTWHPEASATWRGGPGVSRPGVSLDVAAVRGKRIRAEVDIPRELQIEVIFSADEELPDMG